MYILLGVFAMTVILPVALSNAVNDIEANSTEAVEMTTDATGERAS